MSLVPARWPRRSGIFLVVLLLGASRLVLPGSGAHAATSVDEYAVKAAFLLNFARFVEWPEGTFEPSDAPLRICVLGEDPFGELLDQTIAGQEASGRRVEAWRSSRGNDLSRCHVVFVSRSEDDRLESVLDELDATAVLTVGDQDGFARRGGAINFYLERNRVRFEVNPGAARRAGLRISSELLRLGRIVPGTAPEDRS